MAQSVFVRSSMRRRLACVFAALLVLGAAAMPVAARKPEARPDRPGQVRSDSGLGNEDRSRIAAAVASGKKTVTLLIAAEPGRLEEAAAAARGARWRGPSRGFSRRLPEGRRADGERRARQPPLMPSPLSTSTASSSSTTRDPRAAQNPAPQTPPGAATPRNNPYLPIGDTRRRPVRRRQPDVGRPRHDDRGPRLRRRPRPPGAATTTTGEPKIIDWYNANATELRRRHLGQHHRAASTAPSPPAARRGRPRQPVGRTRSDGSARTRRIWRPARPAATSTATASRASPSASSRTARRSGLRRHRPGP